MTLRLTDEDEQALALLAKALRSWSSLPPQSVDADTRRMASPLRQRKDLLPGPGLGPDAAL